MADTKLQLALYERSRPAAVGGPRPDMPLVTKRCPSPRSTIEVDVRPIAVGKGAALIVNNGDNLSPRAPLYNPAMSCDGRIRPDPEAARQFLQLTCPDAGPWGAASNFSKPPMFGRDLQALQAVRAADGRMNDRCVDPISRWNGQGIGVPGYNHEIMSRPIPMSIRDIDSTGPVVTTNTEAYPDAVRTIINRTQLLKDLEDNPKKKEQLQILIRSLHEHGQLLNDAKNKRNMENTGITDSASAVPTVTKVIGADGKEYLRFSPYVDVKTARIVIEKDGDIKISGIKNQDIESIGASSFLDTHRNSMFFKALFWGLVASFILFFLYLVAKFFSWLFCTDSCSGCKKKRSKCSC